MRSFAARSRRTLAAAIATALALGAGAVLSATAPAAAVAAEAGCLENPMGAATPIDSADGYTLFVTGDAILANSELEGTLAVGGVATFGDPRGNPNLQYPVFHGGVGGSADYDVPTIDGVDNRLLLSRFASTKVAQVQERGGPAAGAKIFDRTVPAGYTFGPQFGGTGTTYFPTGGSNMSPQLESAVQAWDGGAGADSFVPAADAFTEYFPADRGRDVLGSVAAWQTPAVTLGGEARISLDPAGPNRLTLAALTGVEKFQLTGYSPASPLVVTVAPGDVVEGRLSLPSYAVAGKETPGGDGISYILWDLSALSGDITVTTPNEPVRGALYAPDVHVIFPPEQDGGREFEGQIIAAQLSALQGGKEMHTHLFGGLFACGDAAAGGFSLEKALSLPAGADSGAFDGVGFIVTAEWTIDGTVHSRPFTLTAGAAPVDGPQDLPVGTVVTFSEATPTTVPGFAFESVTFSPARLVIGEGENPVVTATNAYTAVTAPVGGFSLRKVLAGDGAALVAPDTVFQVDYYLDGSPDPAGRLLLPASGATVSGPQDLPAGTIVTFSEAAPSAVVGGSWSGDPVFAPARIVVEADASASVSLTNTVTAIPELPLTDDEDALAVTGSNAPWWMFGAGVVLVGAGFVALLRARRQTT